MNALNILIWLDFSWRTLSELSCQGRMYGGEFIWTNQPLVSKEFIDGKQLLPLRPDKNKKSVPFAKHGYLFCCSFWGVK